jgi:hypothetical protein
MEDNELVTPKMLLILAMAHIDENLLLESDKKTDKKKLFIATEIREKLEDVIVRMVEALEGGNYDIDRPLHTKVFSKS